MYHDALLYFIEYGGRTQVLYLLKASRFILKEHRQLLALHYMCCE